MKYKTMLVMMCLVSFYSMADASEITIKDVRVIVSAPGYYESGGVSQREIHSVQTVCGTAVHPEARYPLLVSVTSQFATQGYYVKAPYTTLTNLRGHFCVVIDHLPYQFGQPQIEAYEILPFTSYRIITDTPTPIIASFKRTKKVPPPEEPSE